MLLEIHMLIVLVNHKCHITTTMTHFYLNGIDIKQYFHFWNNFQFHVTRKCWKKYEGI